MRHHVTELVRRTALPLAMLTAVSPPPSDHPRTAPETLCPGAAPVASLAFAWDRFELDHQALNQLSSLLASGVINEQSLVVISAVEGRARPSLAITPERRRIENVRIALTRLQLPDQVIVTDFVRASAPDGHGPSPRIVEVYACAAEPAATAGPS